ncbi:hypothetical protein PFISCL1PPCAC_1191, partial [Pristionchus fissidentatus]
YDRHFSECSLSDDKHRKKSKKRSRDDKEKDRSGDRKRKRSREDRSSEKKKKKKKSHKRDLSDREVDGGEDSNAAPASAESVSTNVIPTPILSPDDSFPTTSVPPVTGYILSFGQLDADPLPADAVPLEARQQFARDYGYVEGSGHVDDRRNYGGREYEGGGRSSDGSGEYGYGGMHGGNRRREEIRGNEDQLRTLGHQSTPMFPSNSWPVLDSPTKKRTFPKKSGSRPTRKPPMGINNMRYSLGDTSDEDDHPMVPVVEGLFHRTPSPSDPNPIRPLPYISKPELFKIYPHATVTPPPTVPSHRASPPLIELSDDDDVEPFARFPSSNGDVPLTDPAPRTPEVQRIVGPSDRTIAQPATVSDTPTKIAALEDTVADDRIQEEAHEEDLDQRNSSGTGRSPHSQSTGDEDYQQMHSSTTASPFDNGRDYDSRDAFPVHSPFRTDATKSYYFPPREEEEEEEQ